MASSTKPLAGVRVVELARVLAAPTAGQILADLGADVVKLEAPAGDDTRGWGPPYITLDDGESYGAAYFGACNRGKRSAVVDLKTEAGRALARKLAAHADVFLENFKVGGLAAYGLDYLSLRALNPRLVYCSVTGFGQTGPYAHRPGYDFLAQGMGGLMHVTGEIGARPLRAGIAASDLGGGLYAAIGVQAALLQRERTGEGSHVDVALLDATVSLLAYLGVNYLAGGPEPGRQGNTHPSLVPYQPFETEDGLMIVAAGNDGQFERLCGVLGCEHLLEDERFARNNARVVNRAACEAALAPIIRTWRREALIAALEAAGVPAGPVNTVAEVFADPHVRARGLALSSEGAPGIRTPLIIGGEKAESGRPPKLGEHQAEIEAADGWPAPNPAAAD
ncbi:MAG: CoA transferase [Hyphomicrobiales bacterium]|nr:CoA transferase [Hyphomicrobiales bacterium]